MKKPVLALVLVGMVTGACFGTPQALVAKSVPGKMSAPARAEVSRLFDLLHRVTETKYFPMNGVSNDSLIWFGILYNNNLGPYTKADASGKYHVPARYIHELAVKYFGKRVRDHSLDRVKFHNGYYLASGTDAAPEEDIKVTRFDSLGGGRYAASVAMYDRTNNHLDERERAILKEVRTGGKRHFIVLAYSKA